MSENKKLTKNGDFLLLWAGQTISMFGSQITSLALPLTAVIVLNASPAEMGILGFAQFAPFLFLSLFVGVWVDRLPRRAILITADFGRVLIIGLVPLLYFLGWLRIEFLYLAGLFNGVLTVFFDVAYQSYLPELVGRDHIIEGNSKMEASRAVAEVSGPGLAGTIVQYASAPVGLLLDALSFLASALFLLRVRKKETFTPPVAERRNVWLEIGEGLQVVLKNPLLRPIAFCTATSNLFNTIITTVVTLYAIRDLGFEPGLLGLIFSLGAIGGLVGALTAGKIAGRLGLGWTIVLAMFLNGLASLLLPLAGGLFWVSVLLAVAFRFFGGFSGVVYNINQVSLRQSIVPARLLGRMNASVRFVVWGTIPIGSVLGGLLGETVGVRNTVLIGAVGAFLAFLWVFLSPVRSLVKVPALAEGETPVSATN